MCTYLKNMEGKMLKDLKNKYFDSIQNMFDRAFKRVNTFVDFRTDLVEGSLKRVREELEQKSTKKQKLLSLQPLLTGRFIKKERIATSNNKSQWKFKDTSGDMDLLLRGDLKTMFEPHVEDKIWKLQQRKEISPYTTYNYRYAEQEASGRIVGIKSLLNVASITAAHIRVNAAQLYYKEIDGGYVAFGGNPKGGKITGKDTIKTGNLDFENVYFVRELKFNLFSVSQMCDKKNSVLFNDTGCIVLSPKSKLIDESQILLRVPRKNIMHSVDLKNIVPKGGLTCLFAKATYDESKIWHRRLGHLNFITMNRLVKRNLVRCLPSKLFENDQTCVACQKGNQHIASYKSKTENSINLPLHSLHMDLFGPTFVKSLMKKMYCLVVTDDYSRFTWVFFLATKDETSGILKSFITGIENIVDHKVKVIRCDNGTEFKNREMNQFCEMKGILRQFSVARTPQQNGVTERRNRTLIEAVRTMLANSKSFSNLLGKADEGFFVGYYLNSKAFRVFNSRTRIVKENLHIRFSENTPNIVLSLMVLQIVDPLYSQDPKSSHDDGSKPSSDDGKKVDGDPRKESKCNDQEKKDNVNITYNVNVADINKVNAVGGKTSVELPFDPNMHALEDYSIFDFSRDDEDDGAEADMNNSDTTIQVSPNPTIRIHKDHPLDQVIGDLQSATQTRRMSKNLEEHRKNSKRIEAIRLFLSYASFKDLVVYQMDVKSAFLYGKIEEEVYVCQPPGFEDPDFLDRVYKIEKALVKIASTPMETQKPLLKDEDGEEVDVHMYRLMIGSLMYLTSSRPDIMFAVCACARYQVNPKVSHLHAVKRIFRYLKGQPKLGLWYPKDSPFDLVAYTDSDYARASLDMKSTTGGCQFLGCRLISWQCKKQTVVANSITEAEYVAASSCYGQVLWIQNQLLDYGYNFMHTKIFIDNNSTICIIKNPVFHSRTKHIEIRYHFIKDCNEKKLTQMVKIHTDKNVADLLTKAFNI
ncbi:putative ribonuclease H-like domain-containing protein [Tanacetum coccineum]